MRRLILLASGLCLTGLLALGCNTPKPPQVNVTTSTGDVANTETPAVAEPSTSTKPTVTESDFIDGSNVASATPTGDAIPATGGASMVEVEAYLRRVLHPGTVFLGKEELMNNGSAVIAMTSVEAGTDQVHGHFTGLGAQVIDQRADASGYMATYKLTDPLGKVTVAVSVTQTTGSTTGCLINYSATPGGGGNVSGGRQQPSNPGAESTPETARPM